MVSIATAGRLVAGRYRLEHVLGRGGMATVYRAQDEQLQRPVALKLVERDPLGGAFASAVRREARAAAAVQHPNVVAVYDVGEWARQPFIVLELVEGGDLRQLLRARGSLEPAEAVWLAYGLSLGLAALHAHGLVHRDVKPGNVLLTRDGRPKLADFGIARAAATTDSLDGRAVVGTAAYLSPEQARGEPVDARTDVYALGLLLYELLAGAPPFAGGSAVEVAARRLLADPQPLRTARPAIPADLADIVDRALARDPARRYADAGEVAAVLAAVVAREPIAAGRPTWASALARPDEPTARASAAAPTVSRGLASAGRRLSSAWFWPGRPGRSLSLPLVGLALLLLTGLALLGQATFGRAVAEVRVPPVAGLPYQEAVGRLEASGLRGEQTEAILTLETPAGIVVTQRPAEEAQAPAGSAVGLTVSAGQVRESPPIPPPALDQASAALDQPTEQAPAANGAPDPNGAAQASPAAERRPPDRRAEFIPTAPEPTRSASGPEQDGRPEKPDKPKKPDKPAGRGRGRD